MQLRSPAFQSTPPREGVTSAYPYTLMAWVFQSTPPREGVTSHRLLRGADRLAFQSTPPREGVTYAFRTYAIDTSVSIHTPP